MSVHVYLCSVFDRSDGEPFLGTFVGATIDESLHKAHAAVLAAKRSFSDEHLSRALDTWYSGRKCYELDEDGISLGFAGIIHTFEVPGRDVSVIGSSEFE